MVPLKNMTNFEDESIRLRRIGSSRHTDCSQRELLLAPDYEGCSKSSSAGDVEDDEDRAGKATDTKDLKKGQLS